MNDEHYRENINNLYEKILFRDADNAGLNHFMSLLKKKEITLEQIEKKLIESEEGKGKHLDRCREMIRNHFKKVMERQIDQDDIEHFIMLITRDGLSIEDVKKLINDSPEAEIKKSTNFLKYAPVFITSISESKIKTMIQSIPWYHYFKFGNVETPPSRTSINFQMWTAQGIPLDLAGKSILDVGTNNGFYSFLCEHRGATRVLAIDSEEFNILTKTYGDFEGFDVGRRILNSSVQYKKMNVYDLDKLNETFDFVLMFGVYYHLANPVLALQKILPKVNNSLFLTGHIIDTEEPIMYYSTNHNWWVASPSCLVKIGERIGFRKAELLDTIRIPQSAMETKSLGKIEKHGLFKFSK